MGAGGLVLKGRFALTFGGALGDVVARFKPRWRDPTFGQRETGLGRPRFLPPLTGPS